MSPRALLVICFAIVVGSLPACGGRSTPTPTDARAPDGTGGQATFTCQPQPAGTRGCSTVSAFGASAGDPGVRYPVGCEVIFPFPHPYYPGSSASCRCEESPAGGGPAWMCPL